MGLESASFIHELDASNPVGASDPKSQGDNHLRMIKTCLLNTWPNIDGAVTASHTELNQLAGVTLASGTYVPVGSIVSGITTFTFQQFRYMRIGNIVQVSGFVSIFCSGGVGGLGRITIPIARSVGFASQYEASGSGVNNSTPDTSDNSMVIQAVPADTNEVNLTVPGTGGLYHMQFNYNLV